jgi:UDP-N-acetylmuramate--alanine ligase
MRSAGDISAGLLPIRGPRPIRQSERIHVVGVAGAGASAAALLAHHAGAAVSGCDAGGPSPYTAALAAAGVPLAWQHSADHVQGDAGQPAGEASTRPERLAVTKALTSVTPDHAELAAARAAGVPLEAWQQLVADVAAHSSTLVAVAGTHGKSTSAGWLVDILVRAGRDPSAFVGALLPAELTGGVAATARWGGGGVFVVEADEYAGNFDPFQPDVVLLLNAEWDHPDVFADEDAVLDAFEAWLRRAGADERHPTVVANADDPGVLRLCRRLADWPGELLAVTFADADTVELGTALGPATVLAARLEEAEGGASVIIAEHWEMGVSTYLVGLPGRHNAANALVLVGAGAALGVPDDALRASLAGFGGVGRRLELKGDVGGVVVLDDYAHHPTAIARTLAAVRQRYPGRRLWAVYEPLTFHRTARMLEQFADALAADADRVVIADIWAGRDPDQTVTSSAALAEAVNQRRAAPAVAPGSVETTADHVAANVADGDVVLVMGGGRSYVIAERLVALLSTATG